MKFAFVTQKQCVFCEVQSQNYYRVRNVTINLTFDSMQYISNFITQKVKFSSVSAIKAGRGGGGWREEKLLHTFLTSEMDRYEWLTSRFCSFIPGKEPRYQMNRRVCEP